MDIISKVIFMEQLKKHEGERLSAYKDSVGVLTVGVGHNCEASPVPGVEKPGDKISKEASSQLFYRDIKEHEKAIYQRLPWLAKLGGPRQAVLLNMAFNLGVSGLLGFKSTLKKVENSDFEGASEAMLASRWAIQVGDFPPGSPQADRIGRPGRAWELAEQMRTGKWQGVFK